MASSELAKGALVTEDWACSKIEVAWLLEARRLLARKQHPYQTREMELGTSVYLV